MTLRKGSIEIPRKKITKWSFLNEMLRKRKMLRKRIEQESEVQRT